MLAEHKRLAGQLKGASNWRLWGPYLAERAWGTVREDYSPDGSAWDYFDHDQARFRAYRWNEDGLGGLCDEKQRLCLALALWNGRDPILKERAFGLTANQGNHGEDVKEYYFYLDATPSHSYLRYLYKYPQREYPYLQLVEESRRRPRLDPPFDLLDTGIFADGRYWDVELVYAKGDEKTILLRVMVHNRGLEPATLHLLPTLWFRNTWSWEKETAKPALREITASPGAAWSVAAEHSELGTYRLHGSSPARLIFTENETNFARLSGTANVAPFVKDAFHRLVVHNEEQAVNPEKTGTKCAAWHILDLPAQSSKQIDLVLDTAAEEVHSPARGAASRKNPFRNFNNLLSLRAKEADEFYQDTFPDAGAEDAQIFRQAMAGLIWNKQFYFYDVSRWLDGDVVPPPPERKGGRNHKWRHFSAEEIFSMPDTWEYPWFAAWDLALHCVALALVDIDFAKEQLELLLWCTYLHPNGQIPAYEWSLDDANPPVLAWAALECFRIEREQRGREDLDFLLRIFNKLILNYGWWLNRKDPDNRGIFEGGFMGLDNISVYDRSLPLPPGYSLKQADTSGWMAMLALNLTVMAIELAQKNVAYEEMAIQFHEQFFAIANALSGHSETGISLWDDRDLFFKDVMVAPEGPFFLPCFSWVGLIPIFGVEIVSADKMEKMPRYTAFLDNYEGGLYDGNLVCACPHAVNTLGDHLFSLVMPSQLPDIMRRVLNPGEFFSPHGIRSLSKIHANNSKPEVLPGLGAAMIDYEPGESTSGLFGGNSNWRGPVWFPLNFILIRALEKLQRYLTDSFKLPAPFQDDQECTFDQAADTIAEQLINIFRRNSEGQRPLFPPGSPFQNDPHWQDLLLFHEYFHGETGQGLGASHQTGWTALVANLLQRRYKKSK